MQFDVSRVVFEEVFDGVEEEGEVLFDITKMGTRPSPEKEEAEEKVEEAEVEEDLPPFDEVIADHYSQMVVNARHLTGDVTRADDVVQEATVRALQHWDRFLERFKARNVEWHAECGAVQDFDVVVGRWLHTVVTNVFINIYHHDKRATRRVNEWAVAHRIATPSNGLMHNHGMLPLVNDPREHLDSPVGDEVARAMAALSGDHRKVIEMHYLRGMDCADIAVELGCSKNTVFTRLARARETLGPLLKRYAKARYGIGPGVDVAVEVDDEDEDAA